jgi:phage gp29-like protein
MLSGRGLCNELITRPEESYRLDEKAMNRLGSQRHSKKKKSDNLNKNLLLNTLISHYLNKNTSCHERNK